MRIYHTITKQTAIFLVRISMASCTTMERADHHARENDPTEEPLEIQIEDSKNIPEAEESYEKAMDVSKPEELGTTQLDDKVFDVMPERGTNSISEKGVSELRAEIEMLDLMIARSAVGLLDFQVMKEELDAVKENEEGAMREREMEWKMSESLELKRAIEELKRKKREELKGKEEKAVKGWWKVKWALPLLGLTACVGIVAALVFGGNVVKKKKQTRREATTTTTNQTRERSSGYLQSFNFEQF